MSSIWDKITGKEEVHPHDQPPTASNEPHPPPVSVAEVAKPIVPRQPEEHGFSFSAIKDALIGHSASGSGQPDHPPPVAATQNGHKEPAHNGVSWHEKFLDFLDHGVSNKHEAEEARLKLEREAAEKEVAAKEAEEKATLKGKLKGLFKSESEEAAEHKRLVEEAIQRRREAEVAKHKENSFAKKIKDVFDDDNEEKERERQRLAEEAKRNQSFGARVRNIFDHPDTPPPAPEKHHHLFSHTPPPEEHHHHLFSHTPPPEEHRHLFSHTPPPEKNHHLFSHTPPPEHKKDWKEKLSELTGGGIKAEAKEDNFDKVVGFYQEHVHSEGQQHESLLERVEDREIDFAVRQITGLKKHGHH